MTMNRKKQLKEIFNDCVSDIGNVIISEQMPDNSTSSYIEPEDMLPILQQMISENDISIKELLSFNKDYSIQEIADIVKSTSLVNSSFSIHHFEELEEIDNFIEDRGERKYTYNVMIFKHKDGNFYKFVEQSSADVTLDIEYHGKVEKKEIITYDWS